MKNFDAVVEVRSRFIIFLALVISSYSRTGVCMEWESVSWPIGSFSTASVL